MMKIEGIERLNATLSNLGSDSAILAAVRPAMTAAGADILAASKRAAPRMDGTLVNSASLSVQSTLSSIEIHLGYNTPYAWRVHENPRTGHTGGIGPRGQRYRKWSHVGGAKYLETPMRQAERTVWSEVANGVEAWLQRNA